MLNSTCTPFRYPGGKAKLYNQFNKILSQSNLLNCNYIEPFCGGSGLALKLLLNNKVNTIHLNDIDRSIYAVWHTILFESDQLCEAIAKIALTIAEREQQKEVQKNKLNVDLFQLGLSTIYLNRVNHSGIISGGVIGGKNQLGAYKMDCRFNKTSLISIIKAIAARKNDIEIYNQDAIHFIKRIETEIKVPSLIYFDPPYYEKGKQLYTNFYTHDDHLKLSRKIKEIEKYNWIVTYDKTPEIEAMYYEYQPQTYSLRYSTNKNYLGTELFISNMPISINTI